MKEFYFLIEKLSGRRLSFLFLFFSFFISHAQVTTNGGSGLAANYPDLATAITALNGASITSPVVITLTGNETAPAGGYSITAQGTSTNTIIIEGVASTITANAALTVGALNDGIFKLIGADYVTIRNFTMLENAANTTTAAATNNMTEWGVALLYATTTNGAQNNTIQNNTIDLNRTYQNTFGIYSNSTHTATAPTTSATATTAAGGNSGLKIYSNNITDVNIGILVVGPTAAADNNDGIDIGGASLATGNTITNYGTTGTFSAYANVSGSVNGILVRNSKNFNISYNSITSSNGGVTAGTIRGIFIPAFSNAPTGTIVNSINNNTLSVKTGFAGGTIIGIINEATTNSTTTTLNINNNDFNNFGHTVAGTAAITLINNSATTQITNINSNTFTNLNVNTTGNFTFISNNVTHATGAVTNVNFNSVVTAFNKTGAGGTVYFYDAFGGTVGGSETNTGNNFSNITLTGATTLNGFRTADGAVPYPSKTVTNNTFTNISNGAGTIIILNIGYSNVGSVNNVSNNIIRNISGANSIVGITSAAGDQNFTGNEVSGLNTTGANQVNGISITGGTTQTISRNKIFDIQSNNAGGSVNGIVVSAGTTNNIFNNIIGDLRTPLSNAANPLIGISVTGGTTANVSYNTVMLNGTSSGALFGSSAISVSTTPTVALRNNIFVNNSSVMGAGLATAYRRSTTTLTSYDAASNNNLFYGSTIFTDGTNTDATLAAFKTRVGARDTNSISENPNFVSTVGSNVNFLHINTGIPTQIESGAGVIATITTDFDGDVRNGSTPDIGADEFTGIPLDLTAPTISYTPLSLTCDGSVNRTLTVTITDATGVPTSGPGLPVLYWRINAGAWNNVVATFVSGSTYTFAFGAGAVTSDVISYYVVAQDTSGTPNVGAFPSAGATGFTANPPAASTPPTTPSSYIISNTLTGVYTVGVGGNYTTLTAAVAAYNTSCMSGPVTFNLIDATYPSETFPITINQNANASSVNTLTIKPATGVTATITGSNASAIIKLNGADYVTIDGSNNGTSTRDLTIENTNAAGSVVWIASASAANGSLNNVCKNVNYIGGSTTTTIAGIVVSGTVLGADAESSNNNITITNNTFIKLQNGIFAIGNGTTPDTGWNFSNNILGSVVVASKLGFRGIAVQNAQSFIVSGNQITGITTSTTSTTSGILIGANSFNGNVYNNNISDIKNTNTGGYGANGIYLNSSSTTANILVYNNMIYNIAGYGYVSGNAASDNGYGIICTAGAGYSIYNNSVVLNTNQNVSGLPAAFNVTSGVTLAGAINLRNNIFVNTQTQAGEKYVIYSASANTIFSAIDYNNYYSSGTNLGYIGSARTNLAAIQTGFGQNVNSLSVLPVFVSATDLHLNVNTNTAIDNKGTNIAAVTLDIDGNARNATTPDMGADEFTSLACTSANGGTASALVTSFCDSGTTTVSSVGYSTGVTTSYQWQSSSDLAFTVPVNEGAASGTYANLTTPTISTTTYYRLAVTCAENGSTNYSNVITITVTPSTSNSTTASACDSYTWAVNGTTYTSSGTYTNVVGCHTETLNLTITPSTSNSTTTSACDSYTWAVNGTTYTSSGTYTNVVGCHTETLNLTITPSTTNTTTASACDSYTWAVNGTTYTTSGTYTNVVGCHTETLNLTITPSTTNTTTASACDSYTWAVNGATYTTSGTYTNVVGCHTETLNLTITPSTTNTTTASACDSYTWAVNGTTYTTSGTYTNVVGCHTETLNLTITPSTTNTTTASACDSYTWAVNGTTYTTSGTYTNVVGCHTETLNLTITTASTPTGASSQTINGGVASDVTIEDIVVTGTGIVWYPSAADAAAGTNAIPAGTQLVDGATYYAVSVNGTCVSSPLAVTVTVVLGKESFDLTQLTYYPNPVVDQLTITYNKEITTIEIFDLGGKLVKVIKPLTNEVHVDMVDMSSAIYIFKVYAEDNYTELKVIKK